MHKPSKQGLTFFYQFLSPYICGYRNGLGTQHLLLSLIEKWKKVLDNKGYGRATLIDLSNTFDTISHDLLNALSKCPGEILPGDFPGQSLNRKSLPGGKLCLPGENLKIYSAPMITMLSPKCF